MNSNPNWTKDSNGQWHWTPTKEMMTEEVQKFDPQRAGGNRYFSVYDANGCRRDDRVRYG